MKRSLLKIAEEVNETIMQMSNGSKALNSGRLRMGQLLNEAKELVRTKSNLSFPEWCLNNIRKADGTPFAKATIDNYVMFYRNPRRFAADHDYKKKYKQKQKEAMKLLKTQGSTQIADQVNALIAAWDHACNEARQQFLDISCLDYV